MRLFLIITGIIVVMCSCKKKDDTDTALVGNYYDSLSLFITPNASKYVSSTSSVMIFSKGNTVTNLDYGTSGVPVHVSISNNNLTISAEYFSSITSQKFRIDATGSALFTTRVITPPVAAKITTNAIITLYITNSACSCGTIKHVYYKL